jgi:tRNA(Arg) A34 adenosine deaminase TadA
MNKKTSADIPETEQASDKTIHLSRRSFIAITGFSVLLGATPGIVGNFVPKPWTYDWKPFGKVTTAEEAAAAVLQYAKDAVEDGSNGVGGMIIHNETGVIVQHGQNTRFKPVDFRVVTGPKQTFTWDYTAHGETGLVMWYQKNQKELGLPPASECTIVTSLDPCAMCTGSIMTAGFQAAVVAFDPTGGMNLDTQGSYNTLPPSLRQVAQSTFGFYAVKNSRSYQGGQEVPFRKDTINATTEKACSDIFFDSRGEIRSMTVDKDVELSELKNPALLPATSPLRKQMTERFPDALSLTLADYRKPDAKLKDYLTRLNKNTPGSQNAVALIDPFGNLIAASADRFDIGSAYTAFMNTVRQYALTRYAAFSEESSQQEARDCLTAPANGTVVWLHAPSPGLSTTIKDLGAYASSAGTQSGGNFFYYEDPQTGTIGQLFEEISILPPYYTVDTNIDPTKVVL